jgi:hypothetical protein
MNDMDHTPVRLRIELHRRWATGEPHVALGRLPATVRQDARDEGHRAGGRRPSWSRRKKAVSCRGVTRARRGVARARRPHCHVKGPCRSPADNDGATAVAGDLPTTNRRESGFVWVGVCGQGHVRER